MARLSKFFLLLCACPALAGTWISSPGKGSHAAPGGGAAAYRAVSFTSYASRTNTTINAPAGVTNGDVLILAFIAGGATPPTPTLPAGFTTIQGPTTETDGSFGVSRTLAWKVASGEGASYTITHATASSAAVMVAISGASSSTPVSSSAGGTGFTTTAPSITTPADNSVVLFITHAWTFYGAADPPGGTTPTFTERLDDGTSIMYLASGVLATAGATGSISHTNPNTVAATDHWGAFLVGVGP
jgi:hypothetical protein